MEVRLKDQSPDKIKTDLLVLPVKEAGLKEPPIRLLDRRLKGRISERIKKSHFTGASRYPLFPFSPEDTGRIPKK